MEDSTFEALLIGVNTFIFIVALTVGIRLMGSINDLVEYTKESNATSSGNLIEAYGDIQERTFTGAEVYALYGQYMEGELPNDITVNVKLSGATYTIENYGKNYGISHLSDIFMLENTSKNVFLFERK